MRHALTSLLFTTFFLLSGCSAPSPNYSFEVPYTFIYAEWLADGSLTLAYEITFSVTEDSAPIDIVHLPLPGTLFRTYDVFVSVEQQRVFDFDHSPKFENGLVLNLGDLAIQPGEIQTLFVHVEGIQDVLTVGENNDTVFASITTLPFYIGEQPVSALTAMDVNFYFPEGMKVEEATWGATAEGFAEPIISPYYRKPAAFTWKNPAADLSTSYTFSASFPTVYLMPAAVGQ